MNKKNLFIILLFLFSILFNSCSVEVIDKPQPFILITSGPESGEVLDSNYVIYTWEGSFFDYFYRHRLLLLNEFGDEVVIEDWTELNQNTFAIFNNLDDSNYRFELVGISDGIEILPIQRTFTINSIKNPTIYFFKNNIDILNGETGNISLNMKSIESLYNLSFRLVFDNQIVNLVSVKKGDYVLRFYEQNISPDFTDSLQVNDINSRGEVDITTNFLYLPDSSRASLSGSGELLDFQFKGITSGTSYLYLYLVDLRNSANQVIPIELPKRGSIIVK